MRSVDFEEELSEAHCPLLQSIEYLKGLLVDN